MKPIETLVKHLAGRPAFIELRAMDDMPDEMSRESLQVQDGIAIISVCGVLGSDECCTTKYADIQADIAKAESDDLVRGVLLNVNSPGGYTDGVFECGAAIAAMKKPCWAVAAPIAYSGAYWLASQAKKIYVPPVSGGVGSVGVYCGHMDMSGMLAQMGVVVTLISAGKGKTDGNPYEPLTPEAKKKMQAEVNRLYGEFVGAVSRGRGLSAQDIIALGAECFDGSKRAIGAGLADASGDLATAWVDLISAIERPSPPMFQSAAASAASQSQPKGATMPVEPKADAVIPAPAEATPAPASAAAAPPTPTPAAAAPPSAPAADESAAILELCAVAGLSATKASEFIGKKLTRAQAFAEIQKGRIAASGPETASHILPEAGTATEAKPSQSPVVKACEALAAAKGGK